uniref:Uncharacterized protein n=1 Tax=Rhizophora mucronata TaxID=61149 RepID=A0A2P2Q7E3_RHIMU
MECTSLETILDCAFREPIFSNIDANFQEATGGWHTSLWH